MSWYLGRGLNEVKKQTVESSRVEHPRKKGQGVGR